MSASRTLLPCAAALALVACSTQIQHGLDERQANELQTVLVERGFAAQKVLEPGKKPTWAIELSDEHAIDAVRVLAELGLPRQKPPTTLDILGGGGLVPTPAEERSRQVLGLAGDLSHTLETVDGVASARVHLVLPPPSRPGQPVGVAKASAFLRVRPGAFERLTTSREELRALVAGSLEGLTADNVTLVMSEISSSVPVPAKGRTQGSRLRVLVFILGFAVSAMALAMIVLTVRLRHLRAQTVAAPAVVAAVAAPRTVPTARRAA